MANITKKLILQTFSDMLEEMPFDRITVSALVKRSGISHNTFYYHYQDIYALLETWMEEVIGEPLRMVEQGDGETALVSFLRSCRNKKRTVYHVLNSISREQLERFVFSHTDTIILPFIQANDPNHDLDEQKLQCLADFCQYALLGFFLKYFWSNMAEEPESQAAWVYDALVSFMRSEMKRMGSG